MAPPVPQFDGREIKISARSAESVPCGTDDVAVVNTLHTICRDEVDRIPLPAANPRAQAEPCAPGHEFCSKT
ncbi:hypothetical protein, partial [Pseudomonas viridiflava]|uniref:hypothetical protein n=1 Tax=Pseudomonas viridiflava TaxID=33069 RepID=UPI00197CEAEA